jgi:DNA modification methylase
MAAHRTGRRALLMEREPAYCGVIVTRWQDYTGKNADARDAYAKADEYHKRAIDIRKSQSAKAKAS